MARCRVNDSAALIERHVIGENGRARAIEKRMPELNAFELPSLPSAALARSLEAEFRKRCTHSILGEQKFARGRIHHHIFVIGMKSERAIRGKCPGSRRPGQRAYIGAKFLRLRIAHNRKLHPDRRARVVFVFHFRLGQRRAVVNAPVNRLQPAIDISLLEKREEGAGDGRFVLRIHGQIRAVPLAENAEPLEIPLVRFDEA